MSVSHIPVMMHSSDMRFRPGDVIGTGEVNDEGDLIITIRSDLVVPRVERLAHLGELKELYLSFGWIPAEEASG